MRLKLVILDFDGTLAHRPGMWTQCLLDALDDHIPGHGVTREDLRPYLSAGFPWHEPNIAHTHITNADNWWDALEPTLRRAFLAVTVGVDATLAKVLARSVRDHFCDAQRFELYPDTSDALNVIQRQGLRSVILSNHVPELTDIVDSLGLSTLIDKVIMNRPGSDGGSGYWIPTPAGSACWAA